MFLAALASMHLSAAAGLCASLSLSPRNATNSPPPGAPPAGTNATNGTSTAAVVDTQPAALQLVDVTAIATGVRTPDPTVTIGGSYANLGVSGQSPAEVALVRVPDRLGGGRRLVVVSDQLDAMFNARVALVNALGFRITSEQADTMDVKARSCYPVAFGVGGLCQTYVDRYVPCCGT